MELPSTIWTSAFLPFPALMPGGSAETTHLVVVLQMQQIQWELSLQNRIMSNVEKLPLYVHQLSERENKALHHTSCFIPVFLSQTLSNLWALQIPTCRANGILWKLNFALLTDTKQSHNKNHVVRTGIRGVYSVFSFMGFIFLKLRFYGLQCV